MRRLRELLPFLTTCAVLFALLRLVHLVLPALYPPVLSGPFSLDELGEVRRYTGFSPLLPFYHPQALGARPVNITVSRRPRPGVVIFWQGERFLRLDQTRASPPPPPQRARPLPGAGFALAWREGSTQHVRLEQDGLWLTLRTDLPALDLERMVRTLRRYEELR